MSEHIMNCKDAIDHFFQHLQDFTKSELKQTPKKALICYHLTLGQSIHNMFNLWQPPDKEDKTYEQVLGDRLNLLFEKHGMPLIA